MDELNKNQLILLALLVSFVTSIAASIATASLLEQAPPKVTQTIHKVVERTVETVVPDASDGGSTVTQEKTVIVREEDAITEAITNVSASLVRLYVTGRDAETLQDGQEEPVIRFRGIAVATNDTGGAVIVSKRVAGEQFSAYEVVLPGGAVTTAVVQGRDAVTGIVRLTLVAPAEGTLPTPASLGDDGVLRLGQTLLGLGGETTSNVSIGIVSNLVRDENDAVSVVEASFISDVDGMPAVNLFGEIVGFASSAGSSSFVSSGRVTSSSE